MTRRIRTASFNSEIYTAAYIKRRLREGDCIQYTHETCSGEKNMFERNWKIFPRRPKVEFRKGQKCERFSFFSFCLRRRFEHQFGTTNLTPDEEAEKSTSRRAPSGLQKINASFRFDWTLFSEGKKSAMSRNIFTIRTDVRSPAGRNMIR